jgi:hypothetical protein
MPYLINDFKT